MSITQQLGYITVPTVLRERGFIVRILLPPREHGPPHVHVTKGGTEVVIDLPSGDRGTAIREIFRMRDADAIEAVRLIEAHVRLLMASWRKYHGKSTTDEYR